MRLANEEERPQTLIFSTKEKANAFKKSLKPQGMGGPRGKLSVRKTKGWNTYSLIFMPHSYADIVEVMKHYTPERSHYEDIARDVLREGKSDE